MATADAPSLEYAPPVWATGPVQSSETPAVGHGSVAYYPGSGNLVHAVRYDSDRLREFARDAIARGAAEPYDPPGSDTGPAGQEGFRTLGWSNGIDSRSDLDTATNALYRKIGIVSAATGCTGTLVGRRLVLTAAHCVINGAGQYVAGNFKADASGNLTPYGIQNVVGAWWGGSYINCNTWASCTPQDWAVLLLQDSFPSGHPGYFGLAVLSELQTKIYTTATRGYPGCGSTIPNKPSPCAANHLYGQAGSCTVGLFMWPFVGGFNSTVSLGCDTSPGDSGSATYTTSLGSHHAFAIASTEMCSTCTAEPNPETKAHPNLHKRLDQFIVDLIISLRAAYP